jgi:methylated-DNA-[protein]-cysteine S-methyltransferase
MKKPDTFYYCVFTTSAGQFSVAVNNAGSVVATAFGGRDALKSRTKGISLSSDPRRTDVAKKQVTAWFSGKRNNFSVRLSPAGTPFQKRVWAALRRIPYGETRSYGDVARMVGSSPRAVGRANATNPICLIVPCHRVIGSDGSLTGYAFGERTKRRLLALEAA